MTTSLVVLSLIYKLASGWAPVAHRGRASVLRRHRVVVSLSPTLDRTQSEMPVVEEAEEMPPVAKSSLKSSRRRPRPTSMPVVTRAVGPSKNDKKRRLLSKEEEVALAKRVERLAGWEAARRELNETLGRLPTEAEWARFVGFESVERFEAARLDCRRAKATFISANLALVVAVAKRYRYLGSLDYADLLQEGTFGLTRAVERFNAHLGYRFSTYAVWWIRQAISAAVVDQSRAIRLPPKLHRDLLQLEKAARELELEVGREPTDEELARALDLCVTKVGTLRGLRNPVVSFESPRRSSRGVGSAAGGGRAGSPDPVLGDLLADQNTNPFEFAQSREVRSHIAELFQTALNPRECLVLSLAFGFEDGRPRSLDQIATVINSSASTVRTIKAKALHKLRQPHSGNHILKAHYLQS